MDLNDLIHKWTESKEQKKLQEQKCEKYRKAIERHMNKKDTNVITSTDYVITCRNNTRQQISKQTVPLDIWERYAKRYTYKSYHIKKK